jgi:MSHA biogenesis protein MshQ
VTAPGQGATTRALVGGELGSDAGIARLTGAPNFTLETPFDVSKPANTAWSAPTPIYLRATSPETVAVAKTGALSSGLKAVAISSLRDDPAQSAEDGVMIINGRLNVGSAQGSNTRRTPLRLQAQYWSGAAWVNHTDIPNQAFTAAANYTSCWRDLRAGTATPAAGDTGLQNCNTAILNSPSATQNVTLTGGAGVYLLNAPGAGRAGSVWVQPTGHPWLPATRGRVNFGATRSALIYLREVY